MLGGLGVLAFSLTLPATKAAEPALGAVTVGIGRAVLAAALAALVLLLLGEQIGLATGLAAIVVLASVAVGRNARVDRDPGLLAPPVRTSRKADCVGQRRRRWPFRPRC